MKYYCKSCGNTLFFRKVIEGTIAIPLEIGEYGEEDECEVYDMKDIEFRDIYQSQIECAECNSTNVEEEEITSDTASWEEEDEEI